MASDVAIGAYFVIELLPSWRPSVNVPERDEVIGAPNGEPPLGDPPTEGRIRSRRQPLVGHPGWFHWREGQQEAVEVFGEGSTFVEVGSYLGRSLCSLADVVRTSGRDFTVVGVDTCRGSGEEGLANENAHGPAVEYGGGTFAGLLHRNVIACGFADDVHVFISSSPKAADFFVDGSLAWVHLDARHDYDSVAADVDAWLPKVKSGGWLSGDDYDDLLWPGVVAAVRDRLPGAQGWLTAQWRWLKP